MYLISDKALCTDPGTQFLLIGGLYVALFRSMKRREFLLFPSDRNCVPFWMDQSVQ